MGLGLVLGVVSRRWCVDTSGFKVYNYRKSTTALSLQKRKSQKEGNAMKALLMFLVAACVLALPAAVFAGGCHYHGRREQKQVGWPVFPDRLPLQSRRHICRRCVMHTQHLQSVEGEQSRVARDRERQCF